MHDDDPVDRDLQQVLDAQVFLPLLMVCLDIHVFRKLNERFPGEISSRKSLRRFARGLLSELADPDFRFVTVRQLLGSHVSCPRGGLHAHLLYLLCIEAICHVTWNKISTGHFSRAFLHEVDDTTTPIPLCIGIYILTHEGFVYTEHDTNWALDLVELRLAVA